MRLMFRNSLATEYDTQSERNSKKNDFSGEEVQAWQNLR